MLKKLLLQILPIVFAVLLALALDAWYDNQKQNRLVRSTLADIALDIKFYAELDGVHAFNAAYLDTLELQITLYEDGESVNFLFGFGRPEMNALAWDMAKETGVASDFGRELYKDLARVFLEFDRLTNLWDYHYQFKLEQDPDMDQYTLARHYRRQMKKIQSRHKELMGKSAQFLEKYKDAPFLQ